MYQNELELIERIRDSLNESMISHAEMVHATPEFEISIKRAFALHDFSFCIKEYVDSEDENRDSKITALRKSLNKDSITDYLKSMQTVYPGYENDPLAELVKFFTTKKCSDEFACLLDMHMGSMYDEVNSEIFCKYGIDLETHKDTIMRPWFKSELVLFGLLRIDLHDVYPEEWSKISKYGIEHNLQEYIKPYVLWYYRHNILRKFSELGYMFNVIDPLQFDIILPEPEMDDEMPNIDDDFGDESDSEDVDDMDFDPVEEFDDETDGND